MDAGKAILGVFLATYSSNGDYLPLQYPVSQHEYECGSVLLERAEVGGDGAAAAVAELEKGTGGQARMDQTMHGFDGRFLAQLFSPRPSMSDQRFQVAIDKVLFVGHPLRDDPLEKTQDPDYYDAEQDDAETMSRLASLVEMEGWKVDSELVVRRDANPAGTKLLADLGLMNLMLNREPSETGDSAISEGERVVRDSREWKRRGYQKRVYPRLFHVVFMLYNTAEGIEAVADGVYDHVLRRLTKTLMAEQMEANYVLTQSRLIRSLNEQAQAERFSSARYVHEAMRRSTLAANLIHLYTGLRRGEVVRLHVRKRIMLSLQVPGGKSLGERSSRERTPGPKGPGAKGPTPCPHTPAASDWSADGGRSVAPEPQELWGAPNALPGRAAHASSGHRLPPPAPHQALLLLGSPERVRRRLAEADASPTLVAVVEHASPTKPLAALHTAVDCSFAQLSRVVAHLVYWGVARLICPVSLRHTYVAAAAPTAALRERFARQGFSFGPLPRLLARLHPPRAAGLVLEDVAGGVPCPPARRAEFRDALAFLLREGAVAQRHTWPVLLVPSHVKLNLSEPQFVQLAVYWFRTLHAEHPALLAAFPRALLDRAACDALRADDSHAHAAAAAIARAARDAESALSLARVMRRLAQSRLRDARADLTRAKHGRALRRVERRLAAEERAVAAFCDRVDAAATRAWRPPASPDPAADCESAAPADSASWYAVIRRDPDLAELAREIVDRYVALVPTDAPPLRSDAERRYIANLVAAKPASLQDWFARHSHLFTGANHLVRLVDAEQIAPARIEAMLREFGPAVLLPQHT
ncbi:Nitrogen permease regulator 3 [Coemansia thaxteri]|uniref:Nitrogen permease regulator 3 n=1 Tax=Coemansia thaxteri TaxID=2663907 RepID=A0A9W8BL08_9FUNG|nr:Nitrogen permease regulator 3 [Coemansia thaxteri]